MDDQERPYPQTLQPEDQAYLTNFKNYTVQHNRFKQIVFTLLNTIQEPADRAFVIVCGPSGVGKSNLARYISEQLRDETLLIEIRPPDGLEFHRTDYYRQGLKQMGKTTFEQHVSIPLKDIRTTSEKKKATGKALQLDNAELRHAYEEALQAQGIRAVILDEAQHLIQASNGKQPKDQLDWIKSMTNVTSVLHILIGTYGLVPFCNLDGQMARRGSEIHFSCYHSDIEDDKNAFCDALFSLLKQIPLHVDHDMFMGSWSYFHQASMGCVGILKDILLTALHQALQEGSKDLTNKHIEQHVMNGTKATRMSIDISSGEKEFYTIVGEPSQFARMPIYTAPNPPSSLIPLATPSLTILDSSSPTTQHNPSATPLDSLSPILQHTPSATPLDSSSPTTQTLSTSTPIPQEKPSPTTRKKPSSNMRKKSSSNTQENAPTTPQEKSPSTARKKPSTQHTCQHVSTTSMRPPKEQLPQQALQSAQHLSQAQNIPCPFSEHITITDATREQLQIHYVQCPLCGAMRTIKFNEQYPSHTAPQQRRNPKQPYWAWRGEKWQLYTPPAR